MAFKTRMARVGKWRAEGLLKRFFKHDASIYHHGLVIEGENYRTLHIERQAERRRVLARDAITALYEHPTSLKLQIYTEIANGATIDTTLAGRWLKMGAQLTIPTIPKTMMKQGQIPPLEMVRPAASNKGSVSRETGQIDLTNSRQKQQHGLNNSQIPGRTSNPGPVSCTRPPDSMGRGRPGPRRLDSITLPTMPQRTFSLTTSIFLKNPSLVQKKLRGGHV